MIDAPVIVGIPDADRISSSERLSRILILVTKPARAEPSLAQPAVPEVRRLAETLVGLHFVAFAIRKPGDRMSTSEIIRQQLDLARRCNNDAIAGVTDEHINWMPPGTISPIKAIFLHTVAAEDIFIHRLLQNCPSLWETGGWAAEIGVAQPPSPNGGWRRPGRPKCTSRPSCSTPRRFVTPPTIAWRGSRTPTSNGR